MIYQNNLNYYQQKIIGFSWVEYILQAMMIYKICLFISQHFVCYSHKKVKAPIMLCVISWKSKGLYGSTLSPKYTHFLHSIKFFDYKIGIKFNMDALVAEQNKYAT